MTDFDTPPVEPLFDTWGWAKDLALWRIDQPVPDLMGNAGVADRLKGTLDAFVGLVRPWRIVTTSERGATWVWKPPEKQDAFVSKAIQRLIDYPFLIYGVEVEVDLYVWVRLASSPNRPTRAWVRMLSLFDLSSEAGDWGAYLSFEVNHTLFRPWSKENDDNGELFALNHPLLATALHRWEERFGPIAGVEGWPGVCRYGFAEDI